MEVAALTIDEMIATTRRKLMARDAATLKRLIATYRNVWAALQPEWDVIQAGMEAGKDKAWLLARLRAYQTQIDAEITKYAAWLETEQATAIRESIVAAQQDTGKIIATMYGALPSAVIATIWHQIPTDALETMLGMTGTGSPLRNKMIANMGPELAQRMAQELRKAIALGWGPAKLQRIVEHEMGAGLQWSMAATRTALMQAYWKTTGNIYQNNDVVTGWTWTAALDDRTCIACAMQSGTWHPKTETLNGHYSCRCTMTPTVKSYRDLGIDVPGPPMPTVPSGRKWFEGLPTSRQMEMLGKGKWYAWQDGKIDLADVVTHRADEVYGNMLAVEPLKNLLEGDDLAKYLAKARGRGQ